MKKIMIELIKLISKKVDNNKILILQSIFKIGLISQKKYIMIILN